MQVLLQAFNLLLFRLQACFHLRGSVSQDLLRLLQILDLKLLLEKLVFFLFQVLSRIFFSLIKIFNLFLVLFALLLQLSCDMLDSLSLLLKLSNLGSDLVLVVFLTLDHVFLL